MFQRKNTVWSKINQIHVLFSASSARKALKGPRRLVPPVEEPIIKEGDFPIFVPPEKIELKSSTDDITDVKKKVINV